MSTYAKLFVAAAAVLVVAIVGYQLLPGTGGVADEPTTSASPAPRTLARGTFVAKGADVELDAAGDGDTVTGSMAVSYDGEHFTVDLACALAPEDGRILIAGDTTEAASTFATQGTRTAIILKPGSPVHAAFEFEVPSRPAASCLAFLEAISGLSNTTLIGPDGLEPIRGTVELGP